MAEWGLEPPCAPVPVSCLAVPPFPAGPAGRVSRGVLCAEDTAARPCPGSTKGHVVSPCGAGQQPPHVSHVH